MTRAARIQTYADASHENIGDYLDGRDCLPYKPPTPGGPGIGLEFVAASAFTRSRWVELWLIDTGCGHDLVSSADAKRGCRKLKKLAISMPFQTANGCTVSTHSAPMRIDEFDEDVYPFVLGDTPAVLSVGDRTMNKG